MALAAWFPALGRFGLAGSAFAIALAVAYAVHLWYRKAVRAAAAALEWRAKGLTSRANGRIGP